MDSFRLCCMLAHVLHVGMRAPTGGCLCCMHACMRAPTRGLSGGFGSFTRTQSVQDMAECCLRRQQQLRAVIVHTGAAGPVAGGPGGCCMSHQCVSRVAGGPSGCLHVACDNMHTCARRQGQRFPTLAWGAFQDTVQRVAVVCVLKGCRGRGFECLG